MLDKVKMNVIQTAGNGIVNHETIFDFRQHGKLVKAEYAGGKIEKGYLLGKLEGEVLNFTYCQIRTTGELDHGASQCNLVFESSGKIRLVEHFAMRTNDVVEEGVNVFRQL